MSLLFFLVVMLLVAGAAIAVALAFARAVLYQNVLGELDVTRASRPPARRSAWCAPPHPAPRSRELDRVRRLPSLPEWRRRDQSPARNCPSYSAR